MIGTMVRQLTRNLTPEELEAQGLAPYYIDRGSDVYAANAQGAPFTAAYFAAKGDPLANILEDMAAEQKARATYEHILDYADDPDVIAPLKFLREREIVHFQRFGEAMELLKQRFAQKRVF